MTNTTREDGTENINSHYNLEGAGGLGRNSTKAPFPFVKGGVTVLLGVGLGWRVRQVLGQ